MLCNVTDLFYGAAGRQLPSEHVSWITEKEINESLCLNSLVVKKNPCKNNVQNRSG